MQISLKVKLDTAKDRIVVELEETPAVKSIPVGPPIPPAGGKQIEVKLDKDGYITAIHIPGLASLLKELAPEPTPKGKK